MNLISITVHGFKRFKKKSKINVDGKVVAIVGPNEAGKSSLLKAMVHLNNSKAFVASGSTQELSRGVKIPADQTVIEASYLLEEADKEAVSHLNEGNIIRWLTLSKTAEGTTHFVGLNPKPKRNKKMRVEIDNLLTDYVSIHKGTGNSEIVDRIPFLGKIEQIAKNIRSEKETLPTTTINELNELLSDLNNDPQLADHIMISDKLQQLIEAETDEHPEKIARDILYKRIPQFRFFDDESRLLQSEYVIEQVKNNVPLALNNLCKLADIDIINLADAFLQQDHGKVETIVEEGNEKLKNAILKSWNQAGITVRLRIDSGILHILVKNEQSEYVKVAERSDGLRQFLALMAFTSLTQTTNPPILLIDEAETHLHYDAQADLVQMFAKQKVTSKVIYTTHSIGCLPEDLGTGVRAIEVESHTNSSIKNWFWENEKPGFSPLLFSMGARTLAFIPVRYALIVEGMTEVILLPTLIRIAVDTFYLGFQIVPGLSNASIDEIGLLEAQGPRTAYLVDSDSGGKALQSKLRSGGIKDNRIFELPAGLVIEDLISSDVYVNAINEEINRSHGSSIFFDINILPETQRAKFVEDWCKEKNISAPSKRAIAYRVLESKNDSAILNMAYVSTLQTLYSKLTAVFNFKK
jgi:predicted ATP-dependent endonuclease of OLD family